LMGIFFILNGALIIDNPVSCTSRYGLLDFTEIKWPYGGGQIIVGLAFLWSSLRKKAVKQAKEDKRVLICHKCERSFYRKDLSDLRCPVCDEPLEELRGFYKRHPDL